MIPREIAQEIDRLERQLRLLGGGTVRQAVAGGGNDCRSVICFPRSDVDTGEAMVCEIAEGPILLETETGETLIGINTGSLIAEGTRCEAIHYSCRKGGEAHMLSNDEIESFQSSDEFSDVFPSSGLSSSGGIFADYELFSLEC